MRRRSIKLLVSILILGACFLWQSPLISYGMTVEETLIPEVYMNGTVIHSTNGVDFIYTVNDDTMDVVLQINSPDPLYTIRYDVEPDVHYISYTKTLHYEDWYHKINSVYVGNGSLTCQFWLEIWKQSEFTGGGDYSGGSGGGGSSSEPTTPVDTTIDPNTNTIVVSVSQTQLASLFAMLQDTSNEVKLAIIKIPKVTGLNNYGIQLPYSAFTASNSSGIRLETDIGTLTLMDTMLQDVVQTTDLQNVKFNMGYVDKSTLDQTVQNTIGNHPIIRLNMELDGTTTEWNNPNSPVIISVPYTPTAEELADPEKIVIYYIDGQDNIVTIPNGRYDSVTGQVVFTTTHFSDYAIGFGNKTFTDITDGVIRHKIEVLMAKGIVNGKTDTEFKPNDVVTRAEFVTMLSRAFEFNTTFANSFTDVDSDKYYYKPVGMAKEMGIINGVNATEFNPNGVLNKEQVEIIVNNLIKTKRLTVDNTALTALLSGVDKGTREQVSVLIYNLIK